MPQALIITAPTVLSAPRPNTPAIVIPGQVLYSDGFGGADVASIVGRALDQQAGGLPATWAWDGSAGQALLAIVTGTLRKGAGTGTFTQLHPVGRANYEASLKVVTPPTGTDSIYIDGHRASVSAASTTDTERVQITGATARLTRRVGGVSTPRAYFPFAADDRVGIRFVDKTVALTINGVAVDSYEVNTALPGSFAGLAGVGTATGFILDDWLIKAA